MRHPDNEDADDDQAQADQKKLHHTPGLMVLRSVAQVNAC